MTIQDLYRELMDKQKEIITLITVGDILNWDFETHMPPIAVIQRSEQISLIASLIHEKATELRIKELLSNIKAHKDYSKMNNIENRNIFLIQKAYDKQTKLPKEFVEEFSKQTTITTQIWKKAKNEKNYSLFKPEFDKLLVLIKKQAQYLDPNKEPLDVLMDYFEPGMTSNRLTPLFENLKNELIPIIRKCTSSRYQHDRSKIMKKCPIDMQRKLSEDISNVLSYDLKRGGIDETEHPFTTGYYDDVRITTHYYENDFSDSFYSVIHEAGHGIYEQNLSKKFIYQPIGASASYGVHESQSRFFENILGRSKEFWEFYLPRLQKITDGIFDDISLDDIYKAVNVVKPSKIRTTADEVTYCLHIIIRFELERDLLSGKISTEELPKLWNHKYKEYLNVDIEHDGEGVLQDTHWASGSFGYFPSYALGNIYNAQLLHYMKKDINDYSSLIKKGNFKPILEWLNEKVYQPSNLLDPEELIKSITKEEINIKYFIEYLEEKFSKIYKF